MAKTELIPYSETRRDQIEANLALKELAFRQIGECAVTLYWHKKSNSLSISLLDKAGVNVAFVIEPDEGVDAFYHPYPYADRAGLLDAGYDPDDYNDGA